MPPKYLLAYIHKQLQPMYAENFVALLKNTHLTRRELVNINIFYKILCSIQTFYVKITDFLKNNGITFETFYNTIFKVFMLGRDNAKILFDQINKAKNSFLSWEEFLDGMRTMQVKTKTDRINLFIKIADSDGNGLLSFDEILLLCKSCLKNNFTFSAINFEEDPFLDDLSNYFARLIFQICEVDADEEIPLVRISDIINEGHPNADLLLFFCGADLV